MTITPADAVVAAHSFPRRWRELLARAEEEDLLEQSGAVGLADDAAATLVDTAGRLDGGRAATVAGDDALERMTQSAAALAHAIEAVPTDGWGDGRLDALSEGIDRAASLLRRAEAAVDRDR